LCLRGIYINFNFGGRGSVKRYKLIGLEDAIFKEKVLALFGKKISECSCLKKR
jgi:hypothetical protein